MAVKLAQVIQPSQDNEASFAGELDGALAVPMPPELEKVQGLNIIDSLDTNPTVHFAEPGEYVVGRYAGTRELNISGRIQKMYDLRTPGGMVSVWGSKILDSRLDQAMRKGMSVNHSVMIQYLGDIDTGKDNAAKNFRVAWK